MTKEDKKEYYRRWYLEHRSQHIAAMKKYQTEHPEKHRTATKKWNSSTHASIYEITNLVTNTKYVGSTTINPKKRWHSHIYNIKRIPYRPLYKDMLELGIDNFRFEVLFTCPKAQARKAEQFVMDAFGGELYNIIKASK